LKILAIDVGTGTQDILLLDTRMDIENGFKLVLPSPTMILRQRIQEATRRRSPILLRGVTMGGGPCSWAIEDHLKQGLPVFATPPAARTINDDLEAVAELGVRIISEEEASRVNANVKKFTLGDVDLAALQRVFSEFNVQLQSVDLIAVATFDHGNAPRNYSDRKFRFEYLEKQILSNNHLSAFAFPGEEIPPFLTRLLAVRESLSQVSIPLMIMDTAPAAVLGASLDPVVTAMKRKLIINIGNFHTLAFRLGPSGVEGFFEHHTGMLDEQKLAEILRDFAAGSLTDDQIFLDQGHGARILLDQPLQLDESANRLIVTGPRRSILAGSLLKPYFAVPYGDMMISGCFGLIVAAMDHFPQFQNELHKALQDKTMTTAPWEI
jgi:uncharacterized protein (DUF1786 family)